MKKNKGFKMPKRIAWILPSIIKGSGGLRTIFKHIQALIDAGYECHAYIEGNRHLPELVEHIRKFYGQSDLVVHSGWNIHQSYDLIFATMWHTADYLNKLKIDSKKAYYIQDYEPYFFSMGGRYILAENSYKRGFYPITIGKWLVHQLNAEFGLKSHSTDFCADTNIYHLFANENVLKKELAVCFIHQPEKAHRGPIIGLGALSLLQKAIPNIKIYLFGSNQQAKLPFKHYNLGIISPAQINRLYNKCMVGLCVSSTNPSRIPFEMMAAGLPVVDIFRENNFYDMPDQGVILARQDPESVKKALVQVLANRQQREAMSQFGDRYMRDRNSELESSQFLEAVHHIFNDTFYDNARACVTKIYQRKAVSRNDKPKQAFFEKEYELLTFDVWDTIIRRKCHPDEVKYFTARYIYLKYFQELMPEFRNISALFRQRVRCERAIGISEKKAGNDDEYAILEVFKLLMNEVLAGALPEAEQKKRAGELFALELKHEQEIIYLDDAIVSLLQRIQARQKLFLSDFYMSQRAIKQILSHSNFELKNITGYSSCDLKLNKRTGRSFQKIQADLNVQPGQHIHVGDNEYSDFYIPTMLGIDSIHYDYPAEEQKRKENRKFTQRDTKIFPGLPKLRQKIDRIKSPPEFSAAQSELFQSGKDVSILFFNFVLYLIENLIKEKFDRVWFFTREGEFFYQIYQEIERNNPLALPFPKAEILEVSRIATFAASLREVSTRELMRIWNMYSTQSVQSLFASLDIKTENFDIFFKKYQIDINEQIQYPWENEKIKNLFSDEAFLEDLEKIIARKRQAAKDYFHSKGITDDCKRLAIVDIGWRGTIHDNFAYLFQNTEITGYYFGLFQLLNQQPSNARKFAFGPNQQFDKPEMVNLINFVSPLEMLCNSPNGSVQYYSADEVDPSAVKKVNPSENFVFENFTKYFQHGIMASLSTICEFVKIHAVESANLKHYSMRLLGELMNTPPAILAEAFFHLNHNETFGMGKFVDKKKFLQQKETALDIYLTGDRTQFDKFLIETTWPQGFLKLCKINYRFYLNDFQPGQIISKNDKLAAESLFQQAKKSARIGDWQLAKKQALLALNAFPDQIKVLFFLARLLRNRNMREEAFQHLRYILFLNPNHAPTYNEIALMSFKQGGYRESLLLLKKTIKLQPKYRLAYLNLSKVFQKMRQYEDAQNILLNWLKTHPDDEDTLAYYVNVVNLFLYLKHSKNYTELLNNQASKIFNQEFISDSDYLGDLTLPQTRPIPELPFPGALPPASAGLPTIEIKSRPENGKMNAQADKAPEQPEVSIIILTHNQLADSRKCLASVKKNTRDVAHELVLVDNASTDGTVEYLKQWAQIHSNTQLVFNNANQGFAAGNNLGLARAKGKYVLLLNNDTIVPAGWLSRMLTVFKQHPQTGIVGPMSNYVSGAQFVPEVSYKNVPEMEKFAEQWAANNAGQSFSNPRVVGFCLMTHQAVIQQIGGLDECFGSGNFEDDDFCLRAALAGFEARIAKDVFIHHTGSQTFKGANIDYNASLQHNWKLFKQKWGIPADTPYDIGYNQPVRLAKGASLYYPLPGSSSLSNSLKNKAEAGAETDLVQAQATLKQLLAAGQTALENGNPAAAVQEFSSITGQYPELAAGHAALSTAQLSLGKITKAIQSLHTAIKLAPQAVDLQNQLGVMLYQNNDVKAAESAFLKARRLAPDDIEALLNLIELYRAQGQYVEATNMVKQAVSLNPEDVEVLTAFGSLSLELGDRAGGQLALQRLKSCHPNHPAIQELEQALNLMKKHPPVPITVIDAEKSAAGKTVTD